MASKSHRIPPDPREVEDLIVKLLSRRRDGVTANQVYKGLPPSHREIRSQISARLNDLVHRGQAFAWNPPGGAKETSTLYSPESLEASVGNQIIQLLKQQPLTLPELKERFPPHLGKHLRHLLDPLIRAGTVKWHPLLNRRRQLSLVDPDPLVYLSAELKKLFDKGIRLGLRPEQIRSAVASYQQRRPETRLAPKEQEEVILKTMTTLKPAAARGALVYIPELRAALRNQFPDKASFDEVVMRLAARETVQLQSHSLPAELTAEQRAEMIDNGRGSFFMAIGIQME